ncbi:MAG: hypothetical protein ACLQSR_12855 [Limisphaerales bacterium]
MKLLAVTMQLKNGWNGQLARFGGLPARQPAADGRHQTVTNFRRPNAAASCRRAQPSWPCHPIQPHCSGLANDAVEKWPHAKATTFAKEFSKKEFQKAPPKGASCFLKKPSLPFLCGLGELCVKLNCIVLYRHWALRQ